MSLNEFPKRTVHLDYHTGPKVPDIAKNFDPEKFADTFKRAHVDSVTVFATCHHGMAYWDTDRPERHPGLPDGLDLLGEQIKSLHNVGIRAPVYFSVLLNMFCAEQNPDWVMLDPDHNGRPMRLFDRGLSTFDASWLGMDMCSPYQDYLFDQMEEVFKKYGPVDGVFMDITFNRPSISKWSIASMLERGYDPENPEDQEAHCFDVIRGYMKRYTKLLKEYQQDKPAYIWYNSRKKTYLRKEVEYLEHIELEALSAGPKGSDFPFWAKLVGNYDLPALSHTGRFYLGWFDNGGMAGEKTLMYDCCRILAHNITNGVGDHMPPRGELNEAVYNQIETVYGHVEKCEPYVWGGDVLAEAGLLVDYASEEGFWGYEAGINNILLEIRLQFDVIYPDGEFDKYKLIIIPEAVRITDSLKVSLKSYIKSGGSVIFVGESGIDSEGNAVLEEQGIETDGPSPFSVTFMHAQEDLEIGLDAFGYAFYDSGYRMVPKAGATSLVIVGEPFFERSYLQFSGHDYTPDSNELSKYSAIIQNGPVLSISLPFLKSYDEHGCPWFRNFFSACVDRLLPEKMLKDEGPVHLETTIVQKGSNYVVHLLSFLARKASEHRSVVEDYFPLVNTPIALKMDVPPKRVFLAPNEEDLEFKYKDGYAYTAVTVLNGHAMVVFES